MTFRGREQAPKLLKDQIRMNVNINKGAYNLRNKFQVNQPLRIHNLYGEATFVYFCSKFINSFILEDLSQIFSKFEVVVNFYSKFLLLV